MRIKTKALLLKLVLVGVVAFPLLDVSAVFAAGSYSWAQSNIPSSIYCFQTSLSQTGQYGICANYGGDLYTTSDYGANWVDQTGPGAKNWYGAAVSATGQYMVAADASPGDIYLSSDYGATWTDLSAAGAENWGNVAISANGQVIVADEYTNVHVSTDGGATWTQSTPPGNTNIYPLAISQTGQYVYTAQNGGNVYRSADYGATWITVTSLGTDNWDAINTSPSGQQVVISNGAHDIQVSNDYGLTWTDDDVGMGLYSDAGVAISSDGQTLMAVDENPAGTYGYIYESYDGGASWAQDLVIGNGGWYGLAASADLSRVIVDSDSGPLFAGYNAALYVPPTSNTSTGSSNNQPTATTTLATTTNPAAPDTGYGQPSGSYLMATIAGTLAVATLVSSAVLQTSTMHKRDSAAKT